MTRLCLLLVASLVLTGYCRAQSSVAVRNAMAVATELQNASQAQNAAAYGSLFVSNGTWDGPLGQNAIGPTNITAAARQFFTAFGPFRTILQEAKPLSPDVVMVDIYQIMIGRHGSIDSAAVAPGSVLAYQHTTVRTTLILNNKDGNWRILAARVANLAQEIRQ